MMRIICAINESIIDEIDIRNDDIANSGTCVYHVYRPKGYEHLDIAHEREESWHILAERALATLNEAGYDQKTNALADILIKSHVLEKDS